MHLAKLRCCDSKQNEDGDGENPTGGASEGGSGCDCVQLLSTVWMVAVHRNYFLIFVGF